MLNLRRRYPAIISTVLLSLVLILTAMNTQAAAIILNADTAETGGALDFFPLVTHHGTITFAGEIRDVGNDMDFIAAGAQGFVFDIDDTESSATLSFDFDVSAINFIYGGNDGVFGISALNIDGTIVDSFFQDDTGSGQPAGPITLSGVGIREIVWKDDSGAIGDFAPIDNITISTVPIPGAIWLFGSAIVGLAGFRKYKLK